MSHPWYLAPQHPTLPHFSSSHFLTVPCPLKCPLTLSPPLALSCLLVPPLHHTATLPHSAALSPHPALPCCTALAPHPAQHRTDAPRRLTSQRLVPSPCLASLPHPLESSPHPALSPCPALSPHPVLMARPASLPRPTLLPPSLVSLHLTTHHPSCLPLWHLSTTIRFPPPPPVACLFQSHNSPLKWCTIPTKIFFNSCCNPNFVDHYKRKPIR